MNKKIEGDAINIRPLVRRDIDPILAIWWNDIPKKEMVASQQGGPLDLSFVAETEGNLAGFILARLEYQGFPINEVAVIHSIAVAPKFQGRGISRLLVDKLRNDCKAKGIPAIRILIPQDDTKLIELFAHLGFSLSNSLNFDKPC
jgi:ribosomal protein S18 acetylase RimI-like enzyme